jgi:hypothetical protein
MERFKYNSFNLYKYTMQSIVVVPQGLLKYYKLIITFIIIIVIILKY